MKPINNFTSEKLKFFILLPRQNDFSDWDILTYEKNQAKINHNKYNYVQLHHAESTGSVYIFVIQYIYIKEISKKLKNKNSKLYEFPANLSLDEFNYKWIKGKIKLKDLAEINKDNL